MSLALGFWIAAEIGSTTWEGPDLTAGNPIMLRLILRDLWNAYSGTVMRMLAGAFVAAVVLCVVLEAYFRATRPVAACKLTHTVTLSDSADLPAYTAYPPTVAWIRDDY